MASGKKMDSGISIDDTNSDVVYKYDLENGIKKAKLGKWLIPVACAVAAVIVGVGTWAAFNQADVATKANVIADQNYTLEQTENDIQNQIDQNQQLEDEKNRLEEEQGKLEEELKDAQNNNQELQDAIQAEIDKNQELQDAIQAEIDKNQQPSTVALSTAQVASIENEVKGAKVGTVTGFNNYSYSNGELTLYFNGVNGFGQNVVYQLTVETESNQYTDADVLNMVRVQKPQSTAYILSSQMSLTDEVRETLNNTSLKFPTISAAGEVSNVNATFENVSMSVSINYDKTTDKSTVECKAIVVTEDGIVQPSSFILELKGEISREDANTIATQKFIQNYVAHETGTEAAL